MISDLGRGLTIVIRCDLEPMGNWLSFATWYSAYQYFPDASFYIFKHNPADKTILIFDWITRLNIPSKRYTTNIEQDLAWHMQYVAKTMKPPLLILNQHVEVIRKSNINNLGNIRSIDNEVYYIGKDTTNDFTIQEELCVKARTGINSGFVSIVDGWGKFVMERWIHKNESPFSGADRFATDEMSVNEMQVLKLWKRLGPLFSPSGEA